MGRLHGRQEEVRHRLIDPIAPEKLTSLSRQVLMHLRADVNGPPAILHIAHGHPPAALATDHEALEECAALAHGPGALLGAVGAIGIKLLDVTHKLLPTQIAPVMITEHDRPVSARHPAAARFDTRRLPRQEPRATFGAPVDIGAGVEGVVEHGEDAGVA